MFSSFCESWKCSFHLLVYHIITWPVEMGTFSNVRGCSFAYLNVIMSRHMNICYHLILLCIPTIFGGYIVFLEVAPWSFNKLRNHVIYSNGVWEYKKRIIINQVSYRNGIVLFAYVFQPSLMIVVFVNVVI